MKTTVKHLIVLAASTAAFVGGSVALAAPASAMTAQNSSAVVSLGKLGRVELRAGNSVKQIAAGSQDAAAH